jgi:hypothetical protein
MRYFAILLLIIQFFTFGQNDLIEDLQKTIDELKLKFAPDKRVALFDVNIALQDNTIILSGETNQSEAYVQLTSYLEHKKINIKNETKLLPSEDLGDKIFGIVNLSVANIRSKPDHPEELSTQALLGTVVKLYKKTNDGFYFAQTPDGYLGWIDDDGIFITTEDEVLKWKKSTKLIFTSLYGTAFSKEDNKSEPITDLVVGDIFQFITESDQHYLISLPDGRKGYILKHEAEFFSNWVSNIKVSENNLVSTAKLFMGIPYLWGGTSAKGLDCSGFTKTVFFMNGIILPRDASQQVNVGELVNTEKDFSNLLPGDLLFFGRKAVGDKKEKVTHVAIYIGNGEYIHSAGRVRINSLKKEEENFSEYRFNSFIRAKRILSSIGRNGVIQINQNNFYH